MLSSPGGDTKRLGPLVGAIDQGTCSTRFTVFVAATGELVTYHQIPIETQTPKPGWLELNPHDLITSVVKCIDATVANLEKLDIEPTDVVAIGIASQRCNAIAWDKITGALVYPGCIMAADIRTQPLVDELKKSRYIKEEGVRTISGLPISSYFSAIKFKWLIENDDQVITALAEDRLMIGTSNSYLMWILSGGIEGGIHVTDVTNASLTGLMNIETLTWDEKLCKHFGVPVNILPKIRSCSEIFGPLSISCLKGVPIAGCIGDQQAALVGQNCWRPGQAKISFGNGAFTLFNVGPKRLHSEFGLLSTVAYKLGENSSPVYALEGSVQEAGSIISWLTSIGVSCVDEKIAQAKYPNYDNDIVLIPSTSGCLSPHWRNGCKGMILGMKTCQPDTSNRQEMYQAAIEAVAFQNREVLEAMEKDSKIKLTTILSDGGMSQNHLMMQVQADVLGIPVLRPSMTETTSLGAAIVAGMAKGIDAWKTESTVDLTMDRFLPRLTDNERNVRYERWQNIQKSSFDWTDKQTRNNESSQFGNHALTNHERILRASVSPAIFFWTSFILWKIAHSFSGDQ